MTNHSRVSSLSVFFVASLAFVGCASPAGEPDDENEIDESENVATTSSSLYASNPACDYYSIVSLTNGGKISCLKGGRPGRLYRAEVTCTFMGSYWNVIGPWVKADTYGTSIALCQQYTWRHGPVRLYYW